MSPPFRVLRREFAASLAEVDALCLELRELMTGPPPDLERERFAVELLAREALSNAVRHGCREDPAGRIAFSFRLGSRRAVLKVADPGPGFDWRACLDQPPDDGASHGRGLLLFQAYASRILFNRSGNRIILIRNFPEPAMNEHPADHGGAKALLHPGDLTATTVDAVREQLKELLRVGASELTIDLAGVQMVDSMGIGLLIQTHNSLARIGGALVVRHPSADILALFRSMRLDKRFSVLT